MGEKISRGLIQIYTGNGKGKTTAAIGLAIRAAGRGMKVGFIQFLKGIPTGEHIFISQHNAFEIAQIGSGDIFNKSEEQKTEEAKKSLAYAEEQMLHGGYDLLILDEIFIAIAEELLTTQKVLELLDKKPDSVELVLTGRYAPDEIIERVDLVTEMRMIKHPYEKGIPARRGIEF